jgi:putative colanic acid biosynthesis UDP-glucose lipid carrier transferase
MNKGFLKEHSSIIVWLLAIIDFGVLLGSGVLAHGLSYSSSISADQKLSLMLAVLIAVIIFSYHGLYRPWRGSNRLYEFRTILTAWANLFVLLGVALFLLDRLHQVIQWWLFSWCMMSFVTVVAGRMVFRTVLGRLRAGGYNQRHIVVFSSGDSGSKLLKSLQLHPEIGFKLAAHFCDDCGSGISITGSIADGLSYVEKSGNHVDQIWLAMPFSQEELISDILDALKYSTTTIRLIPDIWSFRLVNHSISTIIDFPAINLSITPMDGVNRYIKGFQDKVISGLILIGILPLMALIALGVKLSSPGPIFYRQERMSINGRSFQMLKFRSMPVNAEADTGAKWAVANENRATRFGGFLRRTSLDELPQFINVLKGDMSIVGPRPERPIFVEKFRSEIPSYMQKHMMKAGITGWAQVNGWRGDTDLNKRIEHDLFYIDNWSLWFDLKIIALTLFKGFAHKNAY